MKGAPYIPGLIAYGIAYVIGSIGVALGLHRRDKGEK